MSSPPYAFTYEGAAVAATIVNELFRSNGGWAGYKVIPTEESFVVLAKFIGGRDRLFDLGPIIINGYRVIPFSYYD